jgi:2-phosphosulfolactate phosphatase
LTNSERGVGVTTQVDLEFWARDAWKAVRRGDLVIVIDVLRSGTSILNALSNGAKAVIPEAILRQAYRLHVQHPEYLFAGERGGQKPARFDLGNSPLEFTAKRVAGKSLVLTTTSGTVALINSQRAKWVLVGAFLNASAVARRAERLAVKEGIGVSFVLAGERGRFSLEDFLCAGAIADSLGASSAHFCDKVHVALLAFKQAERDLMRTVTVAEHAKHLVTLGFKRDIDFSCQLNLLKIVPIYSHGRITLQD